MIELPKLISKRTWFLIFNVGTVAYLIFSGTLQWNVISVVSCSIALLVINCIAWISARKYKEWK